MNVYLAILLITLGGMLVVILRHPAAKLSARFKERAPIIKKYWQFIIPYVILNIVAYAIIALYFYNDINFNILGQVSAMTLAIFVGYIAFSEFGESKFEKLVESASASLDRREFNSAKIKYEEANAIKPKDSDVIGNLLELYLILGMYEQFDTRAQNYMKYSLEPTNALTHRYLFALRSLVVEHMRDARNEVEKTIQLVNENPRIRERFHWSNDEFISSDAYRVLDESTQKIITNYFAYLKRQLTTEQEQRFIEGHYDNVDLITDQPATIPLNLGQ